MTQRFSRERTDLIESLEDYRPTDAAENTHRLHTLHALKTVPDIFERSCNQPGHVTASAWIVNDAFDRVLLQRHKYRDIWMPSGGHMDGCEIPFNVARKEVDEEIGFIRVDLVSDVFDVDTHQVPANPDKNEPEHLHFDIRLLFTTDDTKPLPESPEGIRGGWFTLAEAEVFFPQGGGRWRCLEKIKKLRGL